MNSAIARVGAQLVARQTWPTRATKRDTTHSLTRWTGVPFQITVTGRKAVVGESRRDCMKLCGS